VDLEESEVGRFQAEVEEVTKLPKEFRRSAATESKSSKTTNSKDLLTKISVCKGKGTKILSSNKDRTTKFRLLTVRVDNNCKS
jgi:hypothetical protein